MKRTGGRIAKSIRRNSDMINAIFGGVSNIRSQVAFDDVMEDFANVENDIFNSNKLTELQGKLTGTQLTEEDLYKTEKKFNPGSDYINSTSYKDYSIVGAPIGQEYQRFLDINKEKYADDHSKFYTEEQTPIPEEELQNLRFQRAGFTPEDVQFYNENKEKKLDAKSINRNLSSLLHENSDALYSRGSLGDKLLTSAKDRAKGLMQDDKPGKWNYKATDKYIFKYNDKTNETEMIMIDDGKNEKVDGFLKSIGYSIEPEYDEGGNPTGKYFYYTPTADGWEKTELEADELKYKAYQNKLTEAGLSTEDKLNMRQSFKTGGKVKKGGKNSGPKFSLPSAPEKWKDMTVETVKQMSMGQLKSVLENKKLVSEEVYNAAKERLKGGGKDGDLGLGGDDLLGSDTTGTGEDGEIEQPSQYIAEEDRDSFDTDAEGNVTGLSEEYMEEEKEEMQSITEQQEEVAEQLGIIYEAFLSGEYDPDALLNKATQYRNSLASSGYDKRVIQEGVATIDKYVGMYKRSR